MIDEFQKSLIRKNIDEVDCKVEIKIDRKSYDHGIQNFPMRVEINDAFSEFIYDIMKESLFSGTCEKSKRSNSLDIILKKKY